MTDEHPSDPAPRPEGPSDAVLQRMAASVRRPLHQRLLLCLPMAVLGAAAFGFGIALAGGRLNGTVAALGFVAGFAAAAFSTFVARPRMLRLYGDGTL